MSHPLPAKLEGKLPQPLPLSNMVVRANYCHIDNLSGLLRSHWERFEWFDASRQTWVPSARAYSQYGLCACDLKKGFDPTDREAPARWVFRELESCGQIEAVFLGDLGAKTMVTVFFHDMEDCRRAMALRAVYAIGARQVEMAVTYYTAVTGNGWRLIKKVDYEENRQASMATPAYTAAMARANDWRSPTPRPQPETKDKLPQHLLSLSHVPTHLRPPFAGLLSRTTRPDLNAIETEMRRMQSASLLPRRTVHLSREEDWLGHPPYAVAFQARRTHADAVAWVGGSVWEGADDEDPYPGQNLLRGLGLDYAEERNPYVKKFAEGDLDETHDSVQVLGHIEASTWATLNLPQSGPDFYDMKTRRKELQKMSILDGAANSTLTIDYRKYMRLKRPDGSTTLHSIALHEQDDMDVDEDLPAAGTRDSGQGNSMDVYAPLSGEYDVSGIGREEDPFAPAEEFDEDFDDELPFWDA